MPMFEWSKGVLIGSRAFLKVLVWVSIVLSLLLAVYLAVKVSVLLGIVVGIGVFLVAPLLYVLLFLVLSLITFPFRWLLSRGRSHPPSNIPEQSYLNGGALSHNIKKMQKRGDVDGLMNELWAATHGGPYATEAIMRQADEEARQRLDDIRDAFAALGAPALPKLGSYLLNPKWRKSAALCVVCIGQPGLADALQTSQDDTATVEAQLGALEVLYNFALEDEGQAFIEIRRQASDSPHESVRSTASAMSTSLDGIVWERIRSRRGTEDATARD